MDRRKVLFVCIGNMCRSRMAEGMLAHFGGGRYEAHSCGLMSSGDSRHAIRAQMELGIDPSGQWSKSYEEVRGLNPDLVIYLDPSARRQISPFPGAGEEIDWFVDDPIEAWGDEEQVLDEYRRVRDIILEKMRGYFELDLPEDSQPV